MKKFLSLLLAIVMIVSIFPAQILSASAAEVSETLSTFASTGTVASDSLSISWTSNDVTFLVSKGTSSTAIRTSDTDHFRMYVGNSVTISAPGNITKIVMTCTSSSYVGNLNTDIGDEASVSNTVVTIKPTASAASYTISSITKQARVKTVEVFYATVDSGECAHANTETIEAVEATCTTAGNTAGVKCTDCGTVLEGNETIDALGHSNDDGVVTAATCTADGYTLYTCTVCSKTTKTDYVDATGHSYVDGVCSSCGLEQPTGLDGKYYIAAIRSSGNYIYMTNDLGTASTKRYQIVDSGLTELPASIETAVEAQVFELIFDASNSTYKIKTGDQYLGWTSGNSGTLVDEASAITATIDAADSGAYNIHFTATDGERYLALNSNAANNYFAWYKQGQAEDLYLIPVVEAEACAHANTTTNTVDATCTEAGSTTVVCDDCDETLSTEEIAALGHNYVDNICSVCGAEFEGDIDQPDVTEPVTPTVSTATISFADTTQRVSQDTSSQVWSNGGATLTNNKGASTTNIADYSNPARFYKNSDLIIAFPGMTKIEFSCNTAAYATALANSITDTSVSVSVEDKIVTIVPNNGAIDSYTITLSGGQVRVDSITVTASNCEHSWGEWVQTTAPTCTATGVNTSICSLCDETKTETVAATGHSYTYTETAITCANCDYSVAYTLSTIAEAKAYTDSTLVYYVKGVVTYISADKVYIEDSTGGLLVMFTSADAASGIALGDEILVWDCLTTYNGLIETTYTLASEYLMVSSGNELPSQTVTIADLLADTTNEYLAERVVIKNVTIGTINESGNTALTDADGNTINIYKVSGLNEKINANDVVDVTAILSTYNGYQLLVNPGTAADDVVEVEHHDEVVIETVSIATAKAGTAGEYYQVEGTVTYISGQNVYIQDATGGIVVYLTANAATTQVGDTVKAYGTLATYNGLIELTGIDETNTAFYSILSSGNTVDAQAVTMADLAADTTNEYLAEKISLNGVYVSHYSYNSSYGNVTYTLVDGNGNTIQIYRVTVASEEECVAGGSIVNVEAIVSSYNGYQLVTTNDKIVATGTCAHETTELVNASAATCTVAGYTGDTMCTVCQNYTVRGEEIAALGHTEVVDAAKEANYFQSGLTEGKHCSVCNEVLVAQEVIEQFEHPVDFWSISLDGNINVNFVMNLLDTDVVTATVGGSEVVVQNNSDTISVEVAAAQMTDVILLFVNGMQLDASYSVRGYADVILNGEYDDYTKNLVKAMLVYGGASQTAFDHNTSNSASDGITDAPAYEMEAANEIVLSDTITALDFYGASLSYRNKIAVRFYFTADVSGYTVAAGDYTVTTGENNGLYYVEVAGILPQDLGKQITVTVTETDDSVISVSYGPMNYIERMNAKGSEAVQGLVKALFNYYKAANAYITANDPEAMPEDGF